jgi:hypothetical protein
MKFFKTLIAVAAIAVAVPAAVSAAPWQSINQRQANLKQRINQGVRSGTLTRAEASRVRTQFANLQRLEYRYRHNGLSYRERADLDRRFDVLSRRVYAQKHDRQTRRHHSRNRRHW